MPKRGGHGPAEIEKELSIHLANKPGRLAQVCDALAREKINIRAMTLSDATRRGLLRVVVDQPEKAADVLGRAGADPLVREVLTVILPNRPGAFASVVAQLAEAHVTIEYAYCSTGAEGGRTLGVLSVEGVERATKVLSPKSKAHEDRPAGRAPAP